MAWVRRTLAALAIGSAILSRPLLAQHGASASLTHTVSVTVPPRVKVQVAPVAWASQNTAEILSGPSATDGLSLSISATQAWTLSIGAGAGRSQQAWSLHRNSDFAPVTRENSTVASGTL